MAQTCFSNRSYSFDARPILILDESQKIEGEATIKALAKFCSLIILRYIKKITQSFPNAIIETINSQN
jgi:restriction endonuclease